MKRLEKYTSTEDKNTIILFQYQNFFLLLVKCRKLSFGINPLQIIQYILVYSIFIPSISNWKKLFRIFAIPGCVLRENLVALKILTMLFERYSFFSNLPVCLYLFHGNYCMYRQSKQKISVSIWEKIYYFGFWSTMFLGQNHFFFLLIWKVLRSLAHKYYAQ